MKSLSFLLVAGFVFVATGHTSAQQRAVADGNWWRSLGADYSKALGEQAGKQFIKLEKNLVIIGIFEGASAYRLLLSSDADLQPIESHIAQQSKSKKNRKSIQTAIDSVQDFVKILIKQDTFIYNKYFAGTREQLVDGLDAFYSDYRNRRIEIDGALTVVLMGITGTPERELNTMTERLRKIATQD